VRIFRLFGAVLVIAAAANSAHAQGLVKPTPVLRTEFIQVMDTEFKQMDADKNGILTRKEIEDFQRATGILAARQRNIALFQALDKDKNGQLTPAEFANLPMSVPAPNAAPVLAQVDTNRDGSITMVEYRTGKLASFDRMDADKDGIVSVAEMKAAGLIK
jgi:hypothetical protein